MIEVLRKDLTFLREECSDMATTGDAIRKDNMAINRDAVIKLVRYCSEIIDQTMAVL
jgi:hypothetical protein